MTGDRERIKELVERSDLRYGAEVLDHIEQIERNGLELTDREEWTPDPGTPAELVAWDFGLLYGYYLASEEIRDGGRLRPDGGTEVSGGYRECEVGELMDEELRTMMEDQILDARRFDGLAQLARDPDRDKHIPLSLSDAPMFRKDAFEARRRARHIYSYLGLENRKSLPTGSSREADTQ